MFAAINPDPLQGGGWASIIFCGFALVTGAVSLLIGSWRRRRRAEHPLTGWRRVFLIFRPVGCVFNSVTWLWLIGGAVGSAVNLYVVLR